MHRYFQDNEQEMRYDVFRTKGNDIGSSVVEGVSKHIMYKRFKQSGVICNRIGSSALLVLRIVWLNKELEQLWQKKQLAA